MSHASEIDASSTLGGFVSARRAEAGSISPERRETLTELANAIRAELEDGEAALTFICTHNSRRSQMSQVWAKVAADELGVEGISTYSGGTEATAFNPRAVAALERAGLTIESDGQEENPTYSVSGWGGDALECNSKKYGDAKNPSSDFIAVMTCTDADGACPVVAGAARRVALTYVDPKAHDNTAREAAAYDERCEQIAREMFAVFEEVAATL